MKIAINGFGRIGRLVFRIALDRGYDVVAINDVHGAKDAEYLLKYDSVYGRYDEEVIIKGDNLIVGKKKIKVLSERDPTLLPWKKLGVDIVIESTGAFREKEKCMIHINSGAKYVLLTAPCKDDPDYTVVPGVNHAGMNKKQKIISVASCTTNCLVPMLKVLNDKFGISRALMTTIHSYTSDQGLHDSYHKNPRRGRAAALNIVPTTTGAAKSVVKVLPELLGKINGLAVRVPVAVGSLVDLVAELNGEFDAKTINDEFKKVAESSLKGIMEYSEEEIVSSDIVGNSHSTIIDGLSTQVDGNLVKVLAWYDNEYGYSNRVCDVIGIVKKW